MARITLRRLARPAAELTAAAIGLLCCMATSDVDEPEPPDDGESSSGAPEDPGAPTDFSADVVLHNATEVDRVVWIRALRPAVDLDCDEIASAPGELLREVLFAPAASWTMPPDSNLALIRDRQFSRSCWAAWIEGDGLAPTIAFWRDGNPAMSAWPVSGRVENDGLIELDDDMLDDGGRGLLFAAVDAPEPAEGCEVSDDSTRFVWSAPVPTGVFVLDAIEVGRDGCIALTVRGDVEVQPPPWFLCVAPEALPFAVGDAIAIENVYAAGLDGVRVRDAEGGSRELLVARGSTLPAVDGFTFGIMVSTPCGLATEPACGTVARAAYLSLLSGNLGLGEVHAGGEPLSIDGLRIEAAVLQQRVALDPECAFGPDVVGFDFELAITREGY